SKDDRGLPRSIRGLLRIRAGAEEILQDLADVGRPRNNGTNFVVKIELPLVHNEAADASSKSSEKCASPVAVMLSLSKHLCRQGGVGTRAATEYAKPDVQEPELTG